jgi:hypothetical protein
VRQVGHGHAGLLKDHVCHARDHRHLVPVACEPALHNLRGIVTRSSVGLAQKSLATHC